MRGRRSWVQVNAERLQVVTQQVREMVDESYEFVFPPLKKAETIIEETFLRAGKRSLLIASYRGYAGAVRLYKFNGEYVLVRWGRKKKRDIVAVSFSRNVERWARFYVVKNLAVQSASLKEAAVKCRNLDQFKGLLKEHVRWLEQGGRHSFLRWLQKQPCMSPSSKSLLKQALTTGSPASLLRG